jgi:F-box interacting protein
MPPPTAAVTIPDDLLVSEILVRLPAESLLRSCRSVCRSWRAAVKDPAFIRRHLELSRARPPTIIAISWSWPIDDDEESTTTAPPARVNSVCAAHCNGLIVVTASTGHTARTNVWNPATMESVAVPTKSPNVGPFTMVTSVVAAIGFDPRTKGYVLSRFFYRVNRMFLDTGGHGSFVMEYDDVGHEVLRLGSGAGWRLTENAPFRIDDSVPPVCVRGAIYRAATDPSASGEEDDGGGGSANVLLRFSLRDETFAVIPLPPRVRSVGRRDRVAELAGELCYAHATGPTAFDVWLETSNDDGERGRPPPKWSLRWHVDFYRPVDFIAPLAVDDGGVLLMSVEDEDLYKYDKRNRVLEKVADMQQVSRPVRWDGSGNRGEDGDESPSCAAAELLVPCVDSLVSITSW